MTSLDLALSYYKKAKVRVEILPLLIEKEAYSDVIREAQEAVELATKAMLRAKGLEPPKFHEVSFLFWEYRDKFPEITDEELKKLTKISKSLRRERELSFYGDIDFIPTEEYTLEDAKEALKKAKFVLKLTEKILSLSK